MQERNESGKQEFSFPGMDVFTEEQASELSTLIQDAETSQPTVVRDLYKEVVGGDGYREDGWPDYRGVNFVERQVKFNGCAFIALRTAALLGKEIDNEELVTLMQGRFLVYTDMPQMIYDHIQQREQPQQ
jgi:hypothetical protein